MLGINTELTVYKARAGPIVLFLTPFYLENGGNTSPFSFTDMLVAQELGNAHAMCCSPLPLGIDSPCPHFPLCPLAQMH